MSILIRADVQFDYGAYGARLTRYNSGLHQSIHAQIFPFLRHHTEPY